VNERLDQRVAHEAPQGLARGVLAILVLGSALGLAYNAMGLLGQPPWGLSWIAVDRVAELPTLEPGPAATDGGTEPATFSTNVTDPMAIGAAARAVANVPEVRDLDRPMQIELDAAKQFFDANAALFVDAREEDEFSLGRIPGAISLTFDQATAAPELLAALDPDGRPIITYCGGGACELSVSVAWEILFAGNSKVLVYMGGYPEWVEAGYPVESDLDGTQGGR